MSTAFAGVGIKFKRGDGGSTEVFTAIAEITGITGPNMSRETIDVTNLDSIGGYREFIASFRDAGEVSLEMNFSRAGYDDLKTDFESSSAVNYQIDMSEGDDPDNTIMDFAAFVTALGNAVTVDDKVTASATIKITGQVALSSG